MPYNILYNNHISQKRELMHLKPKGWECQVSDKSIIFHPAKERAPYVKASLYKESVFALEIKTCKRTDKTTVLKFDSFDTLKDNVDIQLTLLS